MKALPRSLAATSSLQKTWIESSKLPPSSSLLEARSELPSSNPSPSSFDDLCLVKISLRSPSDHTEQKWGSRPFLGASKEQVLLASRQAAKATSFYSVRNLCTGRNCYSTFFALSQERSWKFREKRLLDGPVVKFGQCY